MSRNHEFHIAMHWTGNLGQGTAGYRAYSRNHDVNAPGKAASIPCSSAQAFRGDASRYNPEELLIAALSNCHMLSMLHLCADAGIIVTAYADEATGTMRLNPDGSGEFVSVTLRPHMPLADPSQAAQAEALHQRAHHLCFIARSVNFPVLTEPAQSTL